jgi:predicted alpha/beta hydrolase family esterase
VELERAVATAGPDVILVAHSLGCLQLVHWARETRLSVQGALLVAPADPSGPTFPTAAVGFGPVPLGRLPFPSTLIVSADDPYASATFVQRCADAWGSRLVDIGCRGHINAESGLGDWPEGRRWLEKLTDEL